MVEGNIVLVKCFLHTSKEEQKERLQARLDDATKRWEFSTGDRAERKLWDDYQHAYAEMLAECTTQHAPWYVIPGDQNWYRDLAVSRVIVDALHRMNPQFPPEEPGLDQIELE